MSKKNDFRLDSGRLVRLVSSHFKLILVVSLIASIIAGVTALLIKPVFTATAIVFPANYEETKKYFGSKDGKAWFGQLFELDHYSQVLSSDEIMAFIVKKYNLVNHYELDSADKHLMTKVGKLYYNNLSISRTRYQSIKIEFTDNDPELAANIANDIVAMSDTIMNQLIKQKAERQYTIFQNQYLEYQAILRNFEDSLNWLGGKKGISNIGYQSQELTRGYAKAIVAGNDKAARILERKLKEIGKYSGTFNKNFYGISSNNDFYSAMVRSMVDEKSLMMTNLPYQFQYTLSEAKTPDKKSFPKITLFVVFAAISTFFFTIIVLVIREYLTKTLKEKE